MTPPRVQIPPELMAEGRRLYQDTMTPAHEIAATMGVSAATLRNRIREWGWTRRRHPTRALDLVQALRGATVAAVTAPGAPDATPVPMSAERRARLAARILDIIEQCLDAIVRVLATVNPKDQGEGERSARLLVSVAQTLRETAALLQPENVSRDAADDDPIPHDIDEFRRELARRIHGFVEGERHRAAEIPADGEPALD